MPLISEKYEQIKTNNRYNTLNDEESLVLNLFNIIYIGVNNSNFQSNVRLQLDNRDIINNHKETKQFSFHKLLALCAQRNFHQF